MQYKTGSINLTWTNVRVAVIPHTAGGNPVFPVSADSRSGQRGNKEERIRKMHFGRSTSDWGESNGTEESKRKERLASD